VEKLTRHALQTLKKIKASPRPLRELGYGLLMRLLSDGLVEQVNIPSPYKINHGRMIQHLRITALGEDALKHGSVDPR